MSNDDNKKFDINDRIDDLKKADNNIEILKHGDFKCKRIAQDRRRELRQAKMLKKIKK